ncbi:hypothetical protein HHI36_004767 [Cryptolaemus montrouzieri]|uniref:Jumonji domain-containing protein 4 n=1 Tax=Cryptolaemus montrouzieri TaxID=559131 RepID=A0ABD2NST1_9CUCU
MNFKEYLSYWENYIENEYSKELPLYYLKDWHLQNELKHDCFYEVPIYFSSDWLNEYLTHYNKDDYRFVYMGPKGSWTPFHQDVFSSYSWSTNICGKKRWVLFPPKEEEKLLDDLGNLPYDIEEIPDNIDYFEVIQYPGDALFVPSGWHHQVWNLDNTISINHNWVNGCNLRLVWQALELNLFNVKREISDCEDLENYCEQCQLILRSTFGMHFEDFFNFLRFIALKRLNRESDNYLQNKDTPHEGKYIIFDLESLHEVLELFINHKDVNTSPEMTKLKEDALHTCQLISEKLSMIK